MENIIISKESGFYGSNLTECSEALAALVVFDYPSCAFFQDYGCKNEFVLYRDADSYRSFHFRGPPNLEIRMYFNDNRGKQVTNRWIIPPSGQLNTTPFLLGAPYVCIYSANYYYLEADEEFHFEACKSMIDIKIRECIQDMDVVVMNTDFERLDTFGQPFPFKQFQRRHEEDIEVFKKIYQQRRFEFFRGYTRCLLMASKKESAVQRFVQSRIFDKKVIHLIEEFASKWARKGFIDGYLESFNDDQNEMN